MAPKGPLVVHRVLSHYMQWCITEGTGKTGKTVRTVGSCTVHKGVLAWFGEGDERCAKNTPTHIEALQRGLAYNHRPYSGVYAVKYECEAQITLVISTLANTP